MTPSGDLEIKGRLRQDSKEEIVTGTKYHTGVKGPIMVENSICSSLTE